MFPQTWQELLNDLTLSSSNNSVLNKISSVKCHEKIIRTYLREQECREKLLDWIKFTRNNVEHEKSALKASKFRSWGNEKFRIRDNARSLALYTESVCYAPRDSEELSLALANRSAVLLHMEAFQDCLQDITLALKSRYPAHLHHKLYMRRSQCLAKLGRHKEEFEALQSAQKCLDNVENVSHCNISSLKKNIETALTNATLQLKLENDEQTSENSVAFDVPIPTHGENKNFAYASAALDLRYNEEKGRHVIANRDVKMGDILFVEKPYAFVVLPDQHKVHCHHCCKQHIAPIPCQECILGLYCSEACREESWDQYHQWECQGGLEIMHSIGIAHLGLRVVLKAGPLNKLRHFYSVLKDNPLELDKSYGNKEDNYMAVYQLLPHLDHMQSEDLFQYAMTACMLTLYLIDCTSYFKSEDGDQSLDEMLQDNNSCVNLVGSLILRHIAQLVCNGHAITKLDKIVPENQKSEVVTEQQVRVATAIYPSASMMNHSCDPSIINSFHNQNLVVRACKDIPKGGEVYNCYGPHFRHMCLKERQEVLRSQYFFTCTCGPCSLPLQQDFQERFSALLCSKCDGPLLLTNEKGHEMVCSDCGHSQGYSSLVELVFKAHTLFNEGCTAIDLGDITEALNKFLACWNLRKQCLYRSHRDLSACVDQTAKCYAILGEYGKSVDCLLNCLPAVEEQFGSHSIELANELQKLSDVMICDIRQQPPGSTSLREKHRTATDCVKKAKQILELHYGIWNTGLQDIICKEQQLQQMKL